MAEATDGPKIFSLPNEVLDICFQNLSKLNLARVRLAHPRFEPSAARLLFERIDIPPLPDEALHVFHGLRKSLHLAGFVKTVRFFRPFALSIDHSFASVYPPLALRFDGIHVGEDNFMEWYRIYRAQGLKLSAIFEDRQPDSTVVSLRDLPPLPNVKNIEIAGILDTNLATWLDFIPMSLRTARPSRVTKSSFDDHSLQRIMDKIFMLVSSAESPTQRIQNIQVSDHFHSQSLRRLQERIPERLPKYRDLPRQPLRLFDNPYPLSYSLKRASFMISSSTQRDCMFQQMILHATALEELSIGVTEYVDPGNFFHWFHVNPCNLSPLRIRSFFLFGVPSPSEDGTVVRHAGSPDAGFTSSALKDLSRFLYAHGQCLDEIAVKNILLCSIGRLTTKDYDCYTEVEDWLDQLRSMDLVKVTLLGIPELKRWGTPLQSRMLEVSIHMYVLNRIVETNPLVGMRRWDFPRDYPSFHEFGIF